MSQPLAAAKALVALLERMETTDKPDLTIRVFRFWDAPEELRRLSTNGGDEDWIVIVPPAAKGYDLDWIDRLGACCVDRTVLPDGTEVHIASHS